MPLNCPLHNIMRRTKNIYHYQIRKVRKSNDLIKKHKLIDACLNGNGQLFKEIKKIRKHEANIALSIDGVNEDISDHFKGIYEQLYNSVDDVAKTTELKNLFNEKIDDGQLNEVNKVTPSLVKAAAENLSINKTDPVFSYSSDCLKNGTDQLYELLSCGFKSYLIHGHFTLFLLLATLIPIIKD